MSDPEKSGAPTPVPADSSAPALPPAESPAAAPSAAPLASAPVAGLSAETPVKVGSFGSTRGSGLLRGKRPTASAPSSAAPAPAAGYKPTTIEVIKSQSEYKNPFTGETTVSAPVVNEPAPPAAPVPTSDAGLSAANASLDAPPAPSPAPAPPVAATPKPAAVPESFAKSELNILPPEQAKRPAVHWEAPGATEAAPAGEPPQRRDDRPSFRTERDRREQQPFDPRESREPRPFEPRQPREQRPFESRQPREPRAFEPREPRRDERKFEPRTNQPYQERSEPAAPAKASGGFVGWLKGLFSGKKSGETAPVPGPDRGGQREGDYGERRHHGGRGRGGPGNYRDDNRGPRDGQSQARSEGGQPYQGGEPYGDGQRRRRRRGGRGRFRGEGGGDRGGDRGPRPEGQQGGGAI